MKQMRSQRHTHAVESSGHLFITQTTEEAQHKNARKALFKTRSIENYDAKYA